MGGSRRTVALVVAVAVGAGVLLCLLDAGSGSGGSGSGSAAVWAAKQPPPPPEFRCTAEEVWFDMPYLEPQGEGEDGEGGGELPHATLVSYNRTLRRMAKKLHKCGAVVLEGPRGIAGIDSDGSSDGKDQARLHGKAAQYDRDLQDFLSSLEERVEDVMESRARVRSALKKVLVGGATMEEVFEEVKDEPFMLSGDIFRERNDGRLDIEVPFADPFNRSMLIAHPVLMDLVPMSLGETFKLKSIHVLWALTEKEGNRVQHWHRDQGLLFPNDDRFLLRDVHEKHPRELALPAYGLNAFIPLADCTPELGPTQFSLGSHKWGKHWADYESPYDVQVAPPLRRGGMILADYRTIHRGLMNRHETKPRPVIMLIYGRDWWSDVVNYDGVNYAGINGMDFASDAAAAAGLVSDELTAREKLSISQLLDRHMKRHMAMEEGRFPVPTEAARDKMLRGIGGKWMENMRLELEALVAKEDKTPEEAAELLHYQRLQSERNAVLEKEKRAEQRKAERNRSTRSHRNRALDPATAAAAAAIGITGETDAVMDEEEFL